MAQFTIRVPDELHADVKRAAEEDRRSGNGEIEWLLAAALARRRHTPGSGTAHQTAEQVLAERLTALRNAPGAGGRGRFRDDIHPGVPRDLAWDLLAELAGAGFCVVPDEAYPVVRSKQRLSSLRRRLRRVCSAIVSRVFDGRLGVALVIAEQGA